MRVRSGSGTPGKAPPPAPFIVAHPGSGTTLLRLMLDAHPALAIPPETHFVPELIAWARQVRQSSGRRPSAELYAEWLAGQRRWPDLGLERERLEARLRELGDGLRARAVLRALYGLYAEGRGKRRWGDKTPDYLLSMPAIGRALPEARFVHLIRDGRDVAESRMRWRASRGADPRDAAHWARRWRRWIGRARSHGPGGEGRYLELRYEELVREPEPALRRVCEFAALDWDPVLLRHHELAGERLEELARPIRGERGKAGLSARHRRRKHAAATQPPRREKAGQWRDRMSAAEVAAFEAEAGELLRELGYGVASPAPGG